MLSLLEEALSHFLCLHETNFNIWSEFVVHSQEIPDSIAHDIGQSELPYHPARSNRHHSSHHLSEDDNFTVDEAFMKSQSPDICMLDVESENDSVNKECSSVLNSFFEQYLQEMEVCIKSFDNWIEAEQVICLIINVFRF